MPLDAAPLTQPPDRPPEGGDPALLVGHQRQAVPQPSSLIDVPGGDGVLRDALTRSLRSHQAQPAAADRNPIRLHALIRKRAASPTARAPHRTAPTHPIQHRRTGQTTCSTPGYSTRSDGSGRLAGWRCSVRAASCRDQKVAFSYCTGATSTVSRRAPTGATVGKTDGRGPTPQPATRWVRRRRCAAAAGRCDRWPRPL
jgi:hypothetical protein